MNKRTLSLLCFFALPLLLCAQTQTWHKQLAANPFSPAFCRLFLEGDQIRVNADRAVFQLDQRGTATNFLELNIPTFTPHSAVKKYAPGTGHPYFIITKRSGASSKDFALAAYRPGQGFVHEMVFPDSIGISTFPRPVLLEITDNSYLVFGRLFYRKINYDPATGFTEEWARPLTTVAPIAVIQDNNRLILADDKGNLQAFDADGNELWLRSHQIQLRAIKAVSGGYIACGRTAAGQAVLLRLNPDGTAAWQKTFADKFFNDLIPTADGGYAVAALSAAQEMALVKLDANGDLSWSREYGATGTQGGGASVLELPSGGYLFLGKGKTQTHCIRTDALGNAPGPEPAQTLSRQLKNTALQVEIFPGAILFFNGYDNTFFALEDSIAATLFAFAPWIAAFDPGLNLHLAAEAFGLSSRMDYRPGAAATPPADFNRVWAANRSEIRNLRKDFRLDKSLDDPAPFDLLTWPARGNPNLRYNIDFSPVTTDPNLFPAPFVDVNGDGIYNVYDGDYPAIKGEQMLWWLFTDSTKHNLSNGVPLVVDIQAVAYTYDCGQNAAVEKSLFVEYTLVNRSGNDYSNAYFGFFADPDLGCYLDDYIGSAPQADAMYVYNADAEDLSCNGVTGFGSKIPVQTIGFLNQSLDYSMYYANPSVGIPNPPTTDPDLPNEFYQYLRGRWRDGTPLTRGGTGYNPQSTDTVHYIFPDNPPDPQGWTMCATTPPYGDWRLTGSHGPFQLGAADTFVLQLAFTRHSNIPHPCPDIFGLVVPPLQQLKQWQAEGKIDLQPDLAPVYTLGAGQTIALNASVPGASYAWSTGSTEPALSVSMAGTYTVTITGATGCERVENIFVQTGTGADEPALAPAWKLWPNPASSQVLIDCPDCDAGTLRASVYNAQGQLVRRVSGSTVAVETLPAGLYWLELRDASGWLGGKRLVVLNR